ncbi:MAG: hypothetical protein Q9169_004267 [Polycauliona sp. 2 TL-2023]
MSLPTPSPSSPRTPLTPHTLHTLTTDRAIPPAPPTSNHHESITEILQPTGWLLLRQAPPVVNAEPDAEASASSAVDVTSSNQHENRKFIQRSLDTPHASPSPSPEQRFYDPRPEDYLTPEPPHFSPLTTPTSSEYRASGPLTQVDGPRADRPQGEPATDINPDDSEGEATHSRQMSTTLRHSPPAFQQHPEPNIEEYIVPEEVVALNNSINPLGIYQLKFAMAPIIDNFIKYEKDIGMGECLRLLLKVAVRSTAILDLMTAVFSQRGTDTEHQRFDTLIQHALEKKRPEEILFQCTMVQKSPEPRYPDWYSVLSWRNCERLAFNRPLKVDDEAGEDPPHLEYAQEKWDETFLVQARDEYRKTRGQDVDLPTKNAEITQLARDMIRNRDTINKGIERNIKDLFSYEAIHDTFVLHLFREVAHEEEFAEEVARDKRMAREKLTRDNLAREGEVAGREDAELSPAEAQAPKETMAHGADTSIMKRCFDIYIRYAKQEAQTPGSRKHWFQGRAENQRILAEHKIARAAARSAKRKRNASDNTTPLPPNQKTRTADATQSLNGKGKGKESEIRATRTSPPANEKARRRTQAAREERARKRREEIRKIREVEDARAEAAAAAIQAEQEAESSRAAAAKVAHNLRGRVPRKRGPMEQER